MAFKERGEEWKEYDNAVHWMLITFFICLGITVALFIFALPLSYLVGHGISKSSFAMINKFLSMGYVRKMVQTNHSLPRSFFFKFMDSYFAIYHYSCRLDYRRINKSVQISS